MASLHCGNARMTAVHTSRHVDARASLSRLLNRPRQLSSQDCGSCSRLRACSWHCVALAMTFGLPLCKAAATWFPPGATRTSLPHKPLLRNELASHVSCEQAASAVQAHACDVLRPLQCPCHPPAAAEQRVSRLMCCSQALVALGVGLAALIATTQV